ncbi:MAG: T9SS type A sorting domain-containing protein [Thermaurantimonas sp.]
MRKFLHLFIALILTVYVSHAQVRYLEPVFTDAQIVKMADVNYGINFFAYAPASIGGPQLLPLRCDIYMPDTNVDNVTNRPVIVYLHTGSFLPKGLASPMGEKTDSAAVEICRRFARMGYVAISATYRVGWLANSTDLDLRRGTNLLAVYNAIQDAKTLVRFLRASVLGQGNPFKINTNAITLLGQGSGGYITLAYGTLNKYSELQLDKFKYDNASSTGLFGHPVQAGDMYVDTSVVGDWDGFGGKVTLTGQQTPLGLPEIDMTKRGRNFENFAGIPSDVAMTVNLGGALGDSTWLEAGEPPIVSVHVVQDFFAPYISGMVNVPIGGQFFPVVDVAGSHTAVRLSNTIGNNSILTTNWNDPISVKARASATLNPGQIHHILPFDIPPPNPAMPFRVNSNPWDWWDPNDPQSSNETNPNIKAQSLAYIDTVMGFVAPRIAKMLTTKGYQIPVSVVENDLDNKIILYPNPASTHFSLSTFKPIEKIELVDLTGRIVHVNTPFESHHTVRTEHLPKGVYMVRLYIENDLFVKKVVVR